LDKKENAGQRFGPAQTPKKSPIKSAAAFPKCRTSSAPQTQSGYDKIKKTIFSAPFVKTVPAFPSFSILSFLLVSHPIPQLVTNRNERIFHTYYNHPTRHATSRTMDSSQHLQANAHQEGIPMVALPPTTVTEQPVAANEQPVAANEQPVAANEQEAPESPLRPLTPIIYDEYMAATRIERLTRKSAAVDCPICGFRYPTIVSGKSNGKTQCVTPLLLQVCVLITDGSLWALVFCLVGAPCIPYVFKCFQDVRHECGFCGTPLAIVHKRDGRVELLVDL
jgi:hypothetical protein